MRARTVTGLALLAVLSTGVVGVHAAEPPRPLDVLVLTETAGFRHSSIPQGVMMLEQLAATDPVEGIDLRVTETGDSSTDFTSDGLADYELVVFLSTTGDPLAAAEKTAFEQWIAKCGGFVGIHAAADSGYTWPFYRDLVGGTFASHPATQQAKVVVEDPANRSTAHLPKEWVRTDEWYNYRRNPRSYVCYSDQEAPGVQLESVQVPGGAGGFTYLPDLPPPAQDPRAKNCGVHVLATVDEKSYSNTDGAMGADHPIAWCHAFRGGRSWYTGMGHTEASFTEPHYIEHVTGGLLVAAGLADCGASRANR